MAASSEDRPFNSSYKGLERSMSYNNNLTQQNLPSSNHQPFGAPPPNAQPQRETAHANGIHPTSLIPNIPTNTVNNNPSSSSLREKSDSRERGSAKTDSQSLRERSRGRTGTTRVCGKCGGHLSGQFVRALGDTYHLECFTCDDCGKIVASKFFPIPDQPPNQVPLCEKDYFSRLGLLCHACDGALRGSYITALDRKYHIEHFTCSVCPTVFGAQDSYYEHDGNVYCHYHYSTKFAQRCNGCQTSILKQFVEIFRNGQNQHWHPECYMIHKFWNVRLHVAGQPVKELPSSEADVTDDERRVVREEEENVEEKVLMIWRTLSAFEEKSATCISDMLLHVSNGAYFDGVMAAKKFIAHVDLLFGAADDLDGLLVKSKLKNLSYSREAKLLCKKVVAFFQLLTQSQNTGVRRLGVTQELLTLVTGLAHYLKLLIRICLQGSLRLERETNKQDGFFQFLNKINSLEEKLELENSADAMSDSTEYITETADTCPICKHPVEDKCARKSGRVFHLQCMLCQKCGEDVGHDFSKARWSGQLQSLQCSNCARAVPDAEDGFVYVSKLKHYIHLLKVAHARLLATLRTSGALPHTSDDPNLTRYDSDQGHRLDPNGNEGGAPLLRSDTRSKSYTGSGGVEPPPNVSYEKTIGDIKRLRSTRLSASMRQARHSRILDGSELPKTQGDASIEPTSSIPRSLQIAQERTSSPPGQLDFQGANAIALDDIPRIVQAEQAKEQRPNASKFARGNLVGSEPKVRLVNGHNKHYSGGQDLERAALGELPLRPKRYFSELSALEYFIVRHVAVLSMEPLLEGSFNQEELLELIETKRPTFWGKFGSVFKNDKNKMASKKKGIFGVALEILVERDGAESTDGVGPGALRVPAVVQDAVSAMRTMDMSVEGVFRKNGNIRRLKELSEEIDAKGGEAVDLNKEGPVQIAALLKKFLRALPDPVLSFKLHRLFIASQRVADEEKQRRILHLTCCLLPKAHRDTLEVLATFLNWASSFSAVDEESGSKMDIHNLATVIAPNILYSNTKNPGVDESFFAIEAVHSLLLHNESMCEVPEDIQSILNDSSLFETGADLTTKEILKRFGDIGKHQAQITGVDGTSPPAGALAATNATVAGNDIDSHTPRSRQSRSVAPVVARVDSDLANRPPEQSSVRHIHGTGGGSSHNLNNTSNGAGLGLGIDSLGSGGGGDINAPILSNGGAVRGLAAQSSTINTPSPRLARTPTSQLADGGGAGVTGNISPITPGSNRATNSPAAGVNGSPVHGQYRSPAVGMAAAAR